MLGKKSSKLQIRLAFGIILVTFLATSLSGGLAFWQVRQYQIQRGYNTLAVLSEEKNATVHNWLHNQRRVVEMFALLPTCREKTSHLFYADANTPFWNAARAELTAQLALIVNKEPYFSGAFLLSPSDGQVVAASNADWEGLYRTSDDYFLYGRRGTYVSGLYNWPVTRKPTLTIATPIYSHRGVLVGVLAVNLKLDYLQRLLNQSGLLWPDTRLYFVDSSRQVVGLGEMPDESWPAAVQSLGMDLALQRQSGVASYRNDTGVRVLGAYRWLDDLNVAMLIETPYRSIMGSVIKMGETVFVFGLFLLLFLGGLGYFSSRFVSHPVEEMADAVVRVTQGDLNVRLPENSMDEFGLLAQQFNRMLDELEHLYEELRAQRASYFTLFEEAPDGIVLINASRLIEMANHGFRTMVRHDDKSALENTPLEQYFSFGDDAWQLLLDKGVLRLRGVLHGRDNQQTPVDVRCKTMPDQRIQMIFTDITTQRQIEQLMREMQTSLEKQVARRTMELQAANQELEAFTYSVSHDLRAPLRAINGFLRIFMDQYGDNLNEQGRELLQRVQNNSERLSDLIQHLLVISRLGRRALNIQPLDAETLQALLDDVVSDLRLQQSVYEKIEVRIENLLPCQADPALLRQIFENLLSNAFKFSSKESHPLVEISGFQAFDGPGFVVRDNGIGFDMAYQDKLFALFQRLHSDTEYPGSGAGLTIVRRIVLRHGGRIWAESSPGQGAAFYFTLPAESA